MPFCSQCGIQVGAADMFCAGCGQRQPVAAQPFTQRGDPFQGMSPQTAAVLCYIPVIGWIPSVVVLASQQFRGNRNLRFHAFQGLYIFVAWLVVHEALRGALRGMYYGGPRIDSILEAGLIVVWIFMMTKAKEEPPFALPIVGELAEKSLTDR